MVALVQIKVKRYGRLFDVEGNIKNDLFEIRGLWMKPLNPKKVISEKQFIFRLKK